MLQSMKRWRTRLDQIESIRDCVEYQQIKINLLIKEHSFISPSDERLRALQSEIMKIAEESISFKVINYEQYSDDTLTTLEVLINLVQDQTMWPWSSTAVINSLFEFLRNAIDQDATNKEMQYRIMFYRDVKLKLSNLEHTYRPLFNLLVSYLLQCVTSLGESLVHKGGYQQIKDAIDLQKYLEIDVLLSVVDRWIENQIELVKPFTNPDINLLLKFSLESQLENLSFDKEELLEHAKSRIKYAKLH